MAREAVTAGDVHAAADRLRGHVRRTPLLTSPVLDEIAGRRVFVKAEALQLTGSFKIRGATNAVLQLPEGQGVLAYSSGNHAQGIAWAARARGVSSVVVMPADAPALKIDNTRALGAEVVLYDRAGGESREEIGAALADARGLALVRPYDQPEVIAGQGTVGLEIGEDLPEGLSGDVLVCCGGGGLTAGVALALEDRPAWRVRPVEPEGFDDTARSLAAGRRVSNDRPSGSLCDAIVTPTPGALTFPILARLCGPGLAVSDAEALRTMAVALVRLKVALEPGGAVALAAALWHARELEGDTVVAVASGGNADPTLLTRALTIA